MGVEVIATDDFVYWYDDLEEKDDTAVTRAIDLLAEQGVALGFPQSSKIAGSKYPLRELRIQSGGRPLRVFYIFDEDRQAVLLLGGDKTGDDRFYDRMVPHSEAIWEKYVREQYGRKR